MMENNSQNLLWRVEWVHINAYQAPYYYVVAKRGKDEKTSRRNAIMAGKERSRLADFPHVWSIKLTFEGIA